MTRPAPATGEPRRDDLEHFQLRVLQDAYLDGLALHWERRARQFEWAAPRHGDRHGPGTLEAHRRCTATAAACRARGTNAQAYTDDEAWIAQNFLPWMGPVAVLSAETTDQMIARHQRVIAAVDEHLAEQARIGAA